jgi:signal peptidase II
VLVADQLTKLWIRSYPEGHIIFQAGIFKILRPFTQNTGGAFGLFQGTSLILAVVGIVVIVLALGYVLWGYRRYPIGGNRLSLVALGFILGGIIGNLIDRLRFGGVTDFISIGWWPDFNLADSALVLGTIMLALSLLLALIKPTSSA